MFENSFHRSEKKNYSRLARKSHKILFKHLVGHRQIRALFQNKDRLSKYGISYIKMRRASDRLIYIMGIPILLRRYLDIVMVLRFLCQSSDIPDDVSTVSVVNPPGTVAYIRHAWNNHCAQISRSFAKIKTFPTCRPFWCFAHRRGTIVSFSCYLQNFKTIWKIIKSYGRVIFVALWV